MIAKQIEIDVTSRMPVMEADNGCLILFLFADGKLKGAAKKWDAQTNGCLKGLYKSGDFVGQQAQTLVMPVVPGSSAPRALLVGLGKRAGFTMKQWRTCSTAACSALLATPSIHAASDFASDTFIDGLDAADMAAQFACDLVNEAYCFQLHERQRPAIKSQSLLVTLGAPKATVAEVSEFVKRGMATGRGMSAARDLGNLAPNICTPTYLAGKAQDMAAKFDGLTATIVDEEEMNALGMGAFLAVSQGSREPGKLIIMNYQGRKRSGSPTILLGKGVTFDTGGISIKSSDSMDEMKYDMCGAASVIGTMQAVAELQLPINVVGMVAAAENMPDGKAMRPGDVVRSMSGQTIEILNTDAEGRLVLCDALTYAGKFKPAAVIDMATLTGACVVALGNVTSAVMGNDQGTIDRLFAAGEQSGDPCWQLPLWDEYQPLLDSNFADIANIGGRAAGAITAACFLSRFTQEYKWAHLDIAGIAWIKGKNKGATGRPVPMLLKYLVNQAI